jgi:hypothetical protein
LAHGSPDEFIRAIGYFSGRLKSSASRVPPHYSGPTKYYVHDFEIRSADTPEEQAAADIKLITSLTFADSSYANDPEATFYDGVATLGLIGRLAVNGQFDLLEDSPVLLTTALVDSAADIEYGLDNFSKKELNIALDTLFEPSGNKNYSFGFEVTTQTFFEEAAEAAVIMPQLLHLMRAMTLE